MNAIDQRLKDKNIELPTPGAPVASYVPFVISGNQLFISGQLPRTGDTMIKGTMGKDATLEQAQEAAKVCAILLLAQAKIALGGDLTRVTRLIKMGGFVSSTPEFHDHPKVINGASDLMLEILGDAGKHARFALGVAALPFGALVEIDAIFEIS